VTGEIGCSNYAAMTFREVMLVIQGYSDRMVHDYKNTRLIMYMMARMWGDPKKAPATPEELWKLPGDEPTGPSEDDIAEMFRKLRSKDSQ
jgi:hypothetical protein